MVESSSFWSKIGILGACQSKINIQSIQSKINLFGRKSINLGQSVAGA